MSIEELLQQMEEYRSRREQRDHRPVWLTQLVTNVADMFEPLSDIGRVGYDCQADEHGWLVTMYLGTTEIIGGPRDGQIEHAGFKIDLSNVVALFESLTRFEWYSIANEHNDDFNDDTRAVISAHGVVKGGHAVRLELLHVPPRHVDPGFNRRVKHLGGDDKQALTS